MTHREQTRFGNTESEAGSEQTSVALNDAHQGHHHCPRSGYQSQPVTRSTELLHDLIAAKETQPSTISCGLKRRKSSHQVRRNFAQTVRDEEATQSSLQETDQLTCAMVDREERELTLNCCEFMLSSASRPSMRAFPMFPLRKIFVRMRQETVKVGRCVPVHETQAMTAAKQGQQNPAARATIQKLAETQQVKQSAAHVASQYPGTKASMWRSCKRLEKRTKESA